MSLVLLGEYRNQNSNRYYQFADGVTLTDTAGNALPVDFVVDAFVFPVDVLGAVYLKAVDTATGTLYFGADGATTPFGTAVYDGTATAYIYETGVYGRQIGVVVFGDGIDSIVGGSTVREFTYAATALCPAAYITVNQIGVRGILLDDGTLMTGDVVIKAGPGVDITSVPDTAGGTLVFDFIGTLPPSADDCGDPNPPIQTLTFEREPCSMFSVGSYGAGISLSGYGITQDDICKPKKELVLPDEDGTLPPKHDSVCVPPLPPTPPDCGDKQTVAVAVAGLLGGTLVIAAPSSGPAMNPISVRGIAGVFGQSSFVQTRAVKSVSAVAGQLANFTDPPIASDALEIGIRGLGMNKGGTK